jgi:hypothetical protein
MVLVGTRTWVRHAGSVGVVLKGLEEPLGTVLLAMVGVCGFRSVGTYYMMTTLTLDLLRRK